MSVSPASAPKFEVRVVSGPGWSTTDGFPDTRFSSIAQGADDTWSVSDQGFGNPPTTGSLDAKVGARILAAAEAFLATSPAQAIDPAHDGYSDTITIKLGASSGTYALSSPGADAVRDAVFAAANLLGSAPSK